VVELCPADDHVAVALWLADPRDEPAAIERCRWMLDLDTDPAAVDDALGSDELLAPLVAACPGRRVPGHADGAELAVRAVLGQQVSVAGARTTTARLVARLDDRLPWPDGGLTHLFPTSEALAAATDADLPMPASRRRAMRGLTSALASGDLVIDRSADPAELDARLRALPGIGPWTAAYIRLRATGDPDVFLPSDLGVRHALERMGQLGDPRSAASLAERWRPWRSYALVHLWGTLGGPPAPLAADPDLA
jgi:AraC family transcriptional regulator of adaptative response / DNA-3-methyladenine glycosylase II